MQQYRINYPLLIGLIVGAFVCSGAIYAIHHFQNSRQSGWLLSEAEKAHDEKNNRAAAQYYGQYLSIHPNDKAARIKFANSYLDVAESDDVLPEELSMAIQVLEGTLRESMADVPEGKELRRRLVNLYGRDNMRNWNRALDHLNLLLTGDPNNAELQVLHARYLARSGNLTESIKESYKLIGYDPKTDTFDIKKATAPHSPEVYFDLAVLLRKDKPELAERVANQMVDANSADAEAFVQRGRLRAAWHDADGSRADAQKAYQLKPEDVDVLLFVTDVAADDKNDDKHFDKARAYLATAKKLHPKEGRIYQRSSSLELQQGKFDQATKEIDEGVKAVGGSAATYLLFLKARLQIDRSDIKGARQTIEDMQQGHKLQPEILDYFDAMIMVAEGKWFQASEALSKLRPRIAPLGREIATEVDYDLAMCYERLGRFDLAQAQYQLVVDQSPQNAPALAGLERMKANRGTQTDQHAADPLMTAITDMLKKPKPEQNWVKIDSMIDDFAKKKSLDETAVKILKARVAMMREDYDDATKLLLAAEKLAPKSVQIARLKLLLASANPKIGPAKALEYWQKVVDQYGDQPVLRLDKADLLINLYKDKQDKQPLKEELASLLTGIDKWTPQQKTELWSNMAGRYINLAMIDEARQCLTLAAESQPNELTLRLALFALALEANDADGMQAAEDKILQIVGDKNDSAWLYAEARRKMWLLRRGQLGKEALPEIRSLAKRALEQRKEWHELYSLLAEVELMSNNMPLALKYYDQAEQLGRPTPLIVAQHIRLLSAYGRYADAGKLLDRIPEFARQTLLGPLYAEVLFQTSQVDAALKQARAATEADPNSAQNHYWYSQLLARSSQDPKQSESKRKEILGQAIAEMHKTAELQPEFPDAWFALINYNLIQKDIDNAEKTMRDAQLALSGDNLTSFLARSYETLHRWFDAETMLREIYEIEPTDLQRTQQLAAFYLGPVYPRPDREAKAAPLLNQILKAGADGKIPPNDSNLLWARRMAAKIMAQKARETGEYQNLMNAYNLLASNSQDGSLLVDDKLAIAEILASRPEPLSRKKAIALLEEVGQVQTLSEAAEVTLADLYLKTSRGDWSKFSAQMEKALAKYPNSVRGNELYAEKLLARGDQRSLERAVAAVTKLREIAPAYPPTARLSVRLASKKGMQEQVRKDLVAKMPNIKAMKEIDDAQKQNIQTLAALFVELNDLDSAEKLYRDLADRDPASVYNLAEFLGKHRSPEQCFQKLNEIYSVDRVPRILGVALGVARDRRDKIGDKFDADIQRWLDAGLRENPDSISLLIVQADLYDLQKRYDDAAKIYRDLLKRNELKGMQRAVVLNNLAYLAALAGKSTTTDVDPLTLIQEAEKILGPNSDILDTRAVVYSSRKQYDKAIADLDLSVTDGPTASKYFHLAVAQLGAGNTRAALEAWKQAEALGLGRDTLNRMEFDLYEKTKIEINKLRGASVTSADSLRKAG